MARQATLLGRARLEKKLKALPGAAKAQIRIAIAESADQVVSLARSLVPKDSGALHDSIKWTWGRAPSQSIVLAATRALGSELTATIYAGNDQAYYARWVEFGTVKMRAQPYFFPAWRANRKSAKAKIKRAVRKAARSQI